MFAQLGDIRFDLIAYFEGLESTKMFNYAEHAVIEGKPKLQYMGEALEEIRIKINLHMDFCNPEAEYKKIMEAASRYKPLAFIFGNGLYKGDYVIEELTTIEVQTFNDGTLMAVDMELKLKEWVRDKVVTMKSSTGKKTLRRKAKPQTQVEPGDIRRQKIVGQG